MRALATALVCAALAAPAVAAEIGPSDLDRLPGARIVILGEVHDNPLHHANQARAVAALRPAALVFEMLHPDQAARATPEARTSQEALEAALGWNASGWPDFAMYYPIFAAAPEAAILGAALPREDVRRAMTDGAAAVFGAGADRFGLDRPLAEADQAAREAAQQVAHCNALPADLLPGMVAAQRLRDAAFARTALQALDQTGGPVVVITGTGHARKDEGIPAALALAAPGVSVLSVGQVEGNPGPDAPYDLWLVTVPTPRNDPCGGFALGG